jgi:hypothetical protein
VFDVSDQGIYERRIELTLRREDPTDALPFFPSQPAPNPLPQGGFRGAHGQGFNNLRCKMTCTVKRFGEACAVTGAERLDSSRCNISCNQIAKPFLVVLRKLRCAHFECPM